MARLGGVEGEDRERRALRRQPSRWQISFVLMIIHMAAVTQPYLRLSGALLRPLPFRRLGRR